MKVGAPHNRWLPNFRCLSPFCVPVYSIIQADSSFNFVLWLYLQPGERQCKWGGLTIDCCRTFIAFSPFYVPACSIIQADSYFSLGLWLYLQPGERQCKWGGLTVNCCPAFIACHLWMCPAYSISHADCIESFLGVLRRVPFQVGIGKKTQSPGLL